ncbi:hypothetical protein [uncultured Bradyrhizobium sp.]|uniref:hypothetical protein n=1 Tax=uncultured Bradyrhizobium sp. TaxID=199684 RepID=UPI0035CC021C
MRIAKPAPAVLFIAAIAALAAASLSPTVPGNREPSRSDVAPASGDRSDPGFVKAWATIKTWQFQLGRTPEFRNLAAPAALDFNPFDDAAPMKYASREDHAPE